MLRRHRVVRLTSFRQITLLATLAVALSFALSGCQFTAGSSSSAAKTAYVRVIDASTQAPAIDTYLGSLEIASNLGEGSFSTYAGVSSAASVSAAIKKHNTTSTSLASSDVTLTAGKQQSILLTDNGTGYTFTVLTDQSTAAPSGESTFRFINEATGVGGVDVYMVPSTATLATSTAIATDVAASSVSSYISFASQTVTMVVVPTGTTFSSTDTTADYASTSLTLTGGEVYSVLIIDSQLTTSPSLQTFMASDIID